MDRIYRMYIVDGQLFDLTYQTALTLDTPSGCNSQKIRAIDVKLPDEFEVRSDVYGNRHVYRAGERYNVIITLGGTPGIVDHHNHGNLISLDYSEVTSE